MDHLFVYIFHVQVLLLAVSPDVLTTVTRKRFVK